MFYPIPGTKRARTRAKQTEGSRARDAITEGAQVTQGDVGMTWGWRPHASPGAAPLQVLLEKKPGLAVSTLCVWLGGARMDLPWVAPGLFQQHWAG